MTLPVWIAGVIYLSLAIASTGVLVLSGFDALDAPGCGMGSACERAANSKFGNVPLTLAGWENVFTPQQSVGTGVFDPSSVGDAAAAPAGPPAWTVGEAVGVGIPVSYLGLAYFVGLLIAWIFTYGGVSAPMRWLVRVGALASVGYIMLMFAGELGCPYCLGAHAANLLVWNLVEFRGRATNPERAPTWGARKAPGVAVAAMAFALTGLGVTSLFAHGRANADAERDMQASVREITADQDDNALDAGAFGTVGISDPGLVPPEPDAVDPETGPNSGVEDGFDPSALIPQDPDPAPDSPGTPEPEPVDDADDEVEPGPDPTPTPDPEADPATDPGTDDPGEDADDPSVIDDDDPAPAGEPAGITGTIMHLTGMLALAQAEPDAPAQPEGAPADGGFRGRYLWGEKEAPIRIVMFVGYQCEDCKRLDEELFQLLMAGRKDITASVKHFPFCKDCNRHVGQQNKHPNGCWAARAAEAAGILRGSAGFWNMHMWLFERGGGFTAPELQAGLVELGYNRGQIEQFIAMMTSDRPLDLVKEDIEEGIGLGLRQTPMIFINGVHFKGWQQPGALTRAIDQVAQQSLPARPHTDDKPLKALDRLVRDWEQTPKTNLLPNRNERTFGKANAPVSIVMYGDYQEQVSAGLDRTFRAMIDQGRELRYEYRHFPFDTTCNTALTRTVNPMGCRAAKAAEAAMQLGGVEAFEKMHAFLMTTPANIGKQRLEAFVTDELGLDLDAFNTAIGGAPAAAVIDEHIRLARQHGVNAIPWVYVNGKRVRRPVIPGGEDVMGAILDRAERP